MTTSAQFCDILKQQGIDFFTGVPCSIFKGVVQTLDESSDVNYVPATSEDTAVGLAAGAFLAGKKPIVLMQNSGLGVCLNALTSLAIIYKMPLLLLISWRGYLGKDAPEHIVMGETMTGILKKVGIHFEVLAKDSVQAPVENLLAKMRETQLPSAIILKSGVLL